MPTTSTSFSTTPASHTPWALASGGRPPSLPLGAQPLALSLALALALDTAAAWASPQQATHELVSSWYLFPGAQPHRLPADPPTAAHAEPAASRCDRIARVWPHPRREDHFWERCNRSSEKARLLLFLCIVTHLSNAVCCFWKLSQARRRCQPVKRSKCAGLPRRLGPGTPCLEPLDSADIYRLLLVSA